VVRKRARLQYPDSRIVALVLAVFPPSPAVNASGSPLTVARPSRIYTGFLTRERNLRQSARR
jgi:hypothetical protein